jgi:hypothetical protein
MAIFPRRASDARVDPAHRAQVRGGELAPRAPGIPRAVGTETIGQTGGIVRAGAAILVVPPFALDFPATITMWTEVGGAVTFQPEGLEFAVPVCLVRGYGERSPQLSFLRVLGAGGRTNDPDALPSLDTRDYAKVFGSLRCCSSYMAAE